MGVVGCLNRNTIEAITGNHARVRAVNLFIRNERGVFDGAT